MKKTGVFAVALILCCSILFGCSSEDIEFLADGVTYEVAEIVTAQSDEGISAPAGGTLLIIRLLTPSNALDSAQSAFFPIDGTPCSVAESGTQFPCTNLSFQSDGQRVQTTLIFEVPSSWEDVKDFTLSGSDFSAVALKKN